MCERMRKRVNEKERDCLGTKSTQDARLAGYTGVAVQFLPSS